MRFPRASGNLTAKEKREDEARFKEWCAEQEARCARQRSAWNAVYPNGAKDRFRDAMLQRAWELLEAGEAEAADALLEFLPEADGRKLLDEFFEEGT